MHRSIHTYTHGTRIHTNTIKYKIRNRKMPTATRDKCLGIYFMLVIYCYLQTHLRMVNIPPVKQTNFSYASKYQLQIALSLGMGACVYFPLLSTLGHIRLEPAQAHPRWHTCVTVFWHLEGLVSLASSILSPSGSYNFSTSFYKVPWALHVCGGWSWKAGDLMKTTHVGLSIQIL